MPKNTPKGSSKGPWYLSMEESSTLPSHLRGSLHGLFGQIEKEFEQLYRENQSLQRRIEALSERGLPDNSSHPAPSSPPGESGDLLEGDFVDGKGSSKHAEGGKAPYSHKIKCQTNKLRAQTTWIMSNLKNPSPLTCSSPIRRYSGHSDGIWDVDVSKVCSSSFGTASADHTAKIWDIPTGNLVTNYSGHSGSVNSISFHPSNSLVLTASGDGSAHIWMSSGSESGSPLRSMCPAPGKVMACAAWYLHRGERILTVGWDGAIRSWSGRTGTPLLRVSADNLELTHVSVHPSEGLFLVSGKGPSFFLYDDRSMAPLKETFSGHNATVTSAFMTKNHTIVSGSDDRTVKIWDMRDHRAPLITIQTDSPVNRLSVSPTGIIAVPQDNRHVRLYDLSGQSIGRLPRNTRQCHNRMVCSAQWTTHQDERPNLFTCGFDMVAYGWSVQPREESANASSNNASGLPQTQGSAHSVGKD